MLRSFNAVRIVVITLVLVLLLLLVGVVAITGLVFLSVLVLFVLLLFISLYNVNYIKGNLLTVLVSALAVAIAVVITDLPLLFAFLIWLSSFLLDATFTYLKRQYVRQYELNIVVRRSKDIELAFIKVAIIESVMIIGIGMVFGLLTTTAADSSFGFGSLFGYSISLILFASIHVMAFVRSYLFLRNSSKRRK